MSRVKATGQELKGVDAGALLYLRMILGEEVTMDLPSAIFSLENEQFIVTLVDFFAARPS
jgi:hypothetical protein